MEGLSNATLEVLVTQAVRSFKDSMYHFNNIEIMHFVMKQACGQYYYNSSNRRRVTCALNKLVEKGIIAECDHFWWKMDHCRYYKLIDI